MKLPEEISVSVKDVPEVIKQFEKANKEIERLNNIIKEVREYITSQKLHKIQDTTGGLTYQERKLLEILDKAGNSNERNKDNK